MDVDLKITDFFHNVVTTIIMPQGFEAVYVNKISVVSLACGTAEVLLKTRLL